MNVCTLLLRLATVASLALATVAAPAAPVTLRLNGQITGHDFIDLGAAAGLTVGTAVSLTLSFNETWSDGTYDFSDPLGPVSGSAQVGGYTFAITGADPFSYTGFPNAVVKVQPKFTGTGPTLGGGDFFGLFAVFTPALALDYLSLGYGFTTAYPDGSTITNYGYALISLDDYSVTPGGPNRLPAPATLPLVMLAALAGMAARATRRASRPR